jgi:two-component system aerobic respiration control sensor histidine kinase ArcB
MSSSFTSNASKNTSKSKRILLEDDEPDVTFTLKKGLENSGMFDVDAFNDPLEALSNFKGDYYDFLLIDVRMPHMSGYDLYDNIRKIDSKVKSCFITAYEINYKAFREQFPTLEMECYEKPLEINEIISKIHEEIGRS